VSASATNHWAEASDDRLLNGVLDEEPGAWNGFYERYRRLMIACVRKVLRRYTAVYIEADIEDTTNMVCLNLIKDDYKKLRAYDPERGCKLSSWVGLIATNTALDALRRRAPLHESLEVGPHDEPYQVADPGASPADVLEHRSKWERLQAAVAQLGDSDRLFMELYYDRQLEPEQIARMMRISINTVYSRKNKVREKLRRIVSAEEKTSPENRRKKAQGAP